MWVFPLISGLCGTPYKGDECPTCKAEAEDAKEVIKQRLHQHREEKDRPIGHVEEWLTEHMEDGENDSSHGEVPGSC